MAVRHYFFVNLSTVAVALIITSNNLKEFRLCNSFDLLAKLKHFPHSTPLFLMASSCHLVCSPLLLKALFFLPWLQQCLICYVQFSLRKTVGKVSPILVTLTSRSDSDSESSNVSLKENKPDGVNPNSNDINFYVRKSEGKIRRFSADWISMSVSSTKSQYNLHVLFSFTFST